MPLVDQIHFGPSQQRLRLEQLKTSSRPVLLYGAGVYAYVLKRFLEASGLQVSAAMVDAAYRSAESFQGAPLITTESVAGRLNDFEVVVGITQVPAALARLKALGASHVHVVDVPDYLNMPAPFMDRAFVEQHAAEFDAALAVFADELSRRTFVAAINTKLNEDLAFVAACVQPDHLYFPSQEFQLRGNEVFLDVGGFTGDTILEFERVTGGAYKKIVSLEPFDDNFARLQTTVQGLGGSRIVPIQIGAWDERARLSFATNELDIDNKISATGTRSIEVDTIDAILAREGSRVSLIKTDINGAEYRALAGARKTLQKDRPRVVTRLHLKEDFYRIPLLLREIAPEMKIRLRQRGHFSMMLVLYADFG